MTRPGFVRVASLLWLDFVNTEPVREGQRIELLGDPADLRQWLQDAGIVSPGAGGLGAAGRTSGTDDLVRFREAIRLRAALRVGAERLVAGRSAGDAMVRAINRVLASRPAYPRLVRAGRGYRSRLEPVSRSPLHPLVPVAESAAWLLEHGEAALVRRCEGKECVLFFYDITRNRSRRWCSMEGCGSRAKAMAYYHRNRARYAASG